MADGDIDDDGYVANLLKQDAEKATKKYELVGMDAFNPKSSRLRAPKPNTDFLRHIIQQTDSHNAALLAKEAEESRARLRQMDKSKHNDRRRGSGRREREAGRLTPPDLSEEDYGYHKRKRRDSTESEVDEDRRRKRRPHNDSRNHEDTRHSKPRREHSRDRRHKGRKRDKVADEERSPRKSRHSDHRRHKERQYADSSDDEHRSRHAHHRSQRHGRRKSRSRSPSRARSSSPRPSRHHKSSRHRHGSRSSRRVSRSPKRTTEHAKTTGVHQGSAYRSSLAEDDSDPLEAIVGPLPAPNQPPVRPRGRGARKANAMGIESRFSSTYDPTTDVLPDSDNEDNWDDSVEAFRDQQRWKQQGAKRLREAGFTDEQVQKWEKGKKKDEEDVKWSARGQAREWDIGKVVGEDGDVELKTDWGRLK